MADFLFSLSLWQLTIVVLGIALAAGLGFSVGIRKVFRMNPREQEADLAIDMMQIASTYIGILLAFAGVLAWQDYKDAQTAIEREASVTSQLYRDLAAYGPEMTQARQDLRAYVTSIVLDEWPRLRQGQRSPVTEAKLLQVFDGIAAVNPADERKSAIYQEAFSQLNQVVALRRDRLSASRNKLPAVLWVVALLGSVLTIAYAAAFATSRYSSLMISGVSLTIGLLFLFLLSVDNPFRGRSDIGARPLIELTPIFDAIDHAQSTAERGR